MALTVKGIASKTRPGAVRRRQRVVPVRRSRRVGRVRKSWVQRLVVKGRRVDRGLGSVKWISLSQAREIALSNRLAARRGENPFGDARPERVTTFAQAARRTLDHLRGKADREDGARLAGPG